jgi:hypothetical protein
MTPDQAMAELVKMLSGLPQPRGKDRHQRLQYNPVQRSDRVIAFIRDPFDAEMEWISAEVVDELFGPEPADDVESPRRSSQ